jgi:hypothetical protein
MRGRLMSICNGLRERGLPNASIPINEDASAGSVERLLDKFYLSPSAKKMFFRLDRRSWTHVSMKNLNEFFFRQVVDHRMEIPDQS